LSGPHSGEFARTVSRLQEMQSRAYLVQAHGG
jgi:predicted ATPase